MTNERDIERLLDTWFADGPAEVPDRVLDDVAARIHRGRQRPAWRLDWRLTSMTSLAKPLVAVVAVVVIAIAAFAITRPATNVAAPTVVPSDSPAVSPSAAPSASASGSAAAVTCQENTTGCAGPLASGEHVSSSFAVPLRYTVPEGWTNDKDIARTFSLSTTGGTAYPINVFARNAIADPASCGPDALAGAGSTVKDFIDHVRNHPGLQADAPVPVTVGGYQGQSIDFSVRSDWKTMCPATDPTNPTVNLLTSTDATLPGRHVGYTQDGRVRWIVLDVAGETVIIEVIGPPSSSQFESAMAADQPIIDSFVFTPGG